MSISPPSASVRLLVRYWPLEVLPGDELTAQIDLQLPSNATEPRTVSWLSAQLRGLVYADRQWFRPDALPPSPAHFHQGDTVQPKDDEEGSLLFTAPHTLLGALVVLQPGKTRSFLYRCRLPDRLPPSLLVSGRLPAVGEGAGLPLRISYALLVRVHGDPQSLSSSSPQILRLPIRVVSPFTTVNTLSLDEISIGPEGFASRVEELPLSTPLRPLLPAANGRGWRLPELGVGTEALWSEHALHRQLSSRALTLLRPVVATISTHGQPLATLRMERSLFFLGDVIALTVDFDSAAASVPCYQVSATLQWTAVIPKTLLRQERQQVGPLTHVIAQEHVATMGTRQCAIMLPVPSEAPHQLQLNLVSLTWELRVEFVAAMHALDRIEDTRVDLTPQSTRTIHLNLIPPHSWPSSSEARLEHAAGRATATPGAI